MWITARMSNSNSGSLVRPHDKVSPNGIQRLDSTKSEEEERFDFDYCLLWVVDEVMIVV